MKQTVIALLLLIMAPYVSGATITCTGDTLVFAESTPYGDMEYVFRKCMANDLYTFYRVSLDGAVVNSAEHSDNIGPFLVKGQGWIGGNHLSETGQRTARTVNVNIMADGKPVGQGVSECEWLIIEVDNELLLPDGTVFADEKVGYLVRGNGIEVLTTHDYRITEDMAVDRYYGMQSMFADEVAVLVPGSENSNLWIPVISGGADNAIRITNGDAPGLSVFVEKSPRGYQAAYMMREDLGTRARLACDDYAYVGNSYGKSYHKLMGDTTIHPGETTRWHGIYSWFRSPLSDTFTDASGNNPPVFAYPAYLGGSPVTVTVDHNGIAAVKINKE